MSREYRDVLIRWYGQIAEAYNSMSEEQQRALNECERSRSDVNGLGAFDWPGWELLIGERPDMSTLARNIFREKRLRKIREGKEPVTLSEHPRVVLHILPGKPLDPDVGIDHTAPDLRMVDRMHPMGGSFGTVWPNFDGFISFSMDKETAYSYVQLFRDGTIEAVNTGILRKYNDSAAFSGVSLERAVFEVLPKYRVLQKELGVEPPLFIMLSLLGVRGYTMGIRGQSYYDEYRPIDRDDLIVPEAIIESLDDDIDKVMRKVFDRVWNSAGWPRSPNFDENGKWTVRR
jgi:hypothetical protein